MKKLLYITDTSYIISYLFYVTNIFYVFNRILEQILFKCIKIPSLLLKKKTSEYHRIPFIFDHIFCTYLKIIHNILEFCKEQIHIYIYTYIT